MRCGLGKKVRVLREMSYSEFTLPTFTIIMILLNTYIPGYSSHGLWYNICDFIYICFVMVVCTRQPSAIAGGATAESPEWCQVPGEQWYYCLFNCSLMCVSKLPMVSGHLRV